MDLKIVNQMSSDQLLKGFSFVVRRERETMVEVIVYLAEMKRRRLYAEEGYSSLFSFLTEKYRYSRGGAYRRIQAAKVALLFPEVLDELRSGRLNLISLCLIEPYLTRTDGKKLIEGVIGKKKEEIEYILSNMFPREEKTKDKIRRLPVIIREQRREESERLIREAPRNQTNSSEGAGLPPAGLPPVAQVISDGDSLHLVFGMTPDFYSHSGSREDQKTEFHFHSGSGESKTREVRRVKIEFVADEEVAELIGRAKELLRHKYPKGRLEDLVREAFELLLQKKDPMRKGEKPNKSNHVSGNAKSDEKKEIQSPETVERKRATSQGNTRTRYIPERIRGEIWKRDGGVCAFVGREGKRCDEKNFLQIDHIKAWALGGESVPDNLQLLCVTHNQLRAEKTFGNIIMTESL